MSGPPSGNRWRCLGVLEAVGGGSPSGRDLEYPPCPKARAKFTFTKSHYGLADQELEAPIA